VARGQGGVGLTWSARHAGRLRHGVV